MSIGEVIAMLEKLIKELIAIFAAYFENSEAEGEDTAE